jgi:hypothetical protein
MMLLARLEQEHDDPQRGNGTVVQGMRGSGQRRVNGRRLTAAAACVLLLSVALSLASAVPGLVITRAQYGGRVDISASGFGGSYVLSDRSNLWRSGVRLFVWQEPDEHGEAGDHLGAVPRWSSLRQDRDWLRQFSAVAVTEQCIGLPFRWVTWAVYGELNQGRWQIRNGIALADQIRPESPVIPFGVLWIPLLMNIVFYATCCLVLRVCMLTVMRRWRPLPDHYCQTCNYDLTGVRRGETVRCPECGNCSHNDGYRDA